MLPPCASVYTVRQSSGSTVVWNPSPEWNLNQ